MRRALWLLLVPLALSAPPSSAHVMQVSYTLPVPFWLYAYGATGALLASFAVVAYFVNADSARMQMRSIDLAQNAIVRGLSTRFVIGSSRLMSVGLLGLAIVTGLVGTQYPATNFNVTFTWIIFALGLTYTVAIIGDVYRVVNPWLSICGWCDGVRPGLLRGWVAYPGWLAYYPALALYMAWIWIELFGHAIPSVLSLTILAYTVLTLLAAWAFGKQVWFDRGELFSVFFRLIGKQAPIHYRCAVGGKPSVVRASAPFVDLGFTRADHFSLLLFVLFMLSSTAFDGIHDTVPFVTTFWRHIYPFLSSFIATGNPRQYLVLVDYFYYWQWLVLILSPVVYLAIYLAFIALAKAVTRSRLRIRDLALQFTFSLIPIAFVYNLAHYFTLLIAQGPAIVSMASDPFGFGWDLFGTKGAYAQPYMLEAGTVWHLQVGFILVGHIISVYLAHVEALKVFGSGPKASLSQIPLLFLMVLLTTIGLWILSLPIAAGQVLLPPPSGG